MNLKLFVKKYREYLLLLLIFFVALFLRLYKQPSYPTCLHRDEAQYAYNAYSILKTGRDEWGELMPIHFRFNGEDHVPLIFYFIAICFQVFGVNDVSVRMPAIILGSLIPIVSYFFIKLLSKDKKLAYIFAFLLVINLSLTMSVAIFIAARAVLLPVLVCKI